MRREGKREALPVVDAAGGGNERRGQQGRRRTEVVETEGWNGVHDTGQQARELGVKDAVAGSNTALATASENLAQYPLVEVGRVGESNSRREVPVSGGRERLRNSRIAGDQQPGKRSGVERGFGPGNVGLYLVVLFPERADQVPAQAGVDGKVASRSPAVLSIGAQIAIAQIERLTGGLREVARDADQEIGIRVAGLRPIDIEGP